LCQSGRRNFQDQQEKVAMAHRLPKVHCKPGRRRPTSEPFQHLKTVKLQHFPTRDLLQIGTSASFAYT
jgi:hypothetical protein